MRFIGRAEVERRTDLTYATIWKLMKAGKFPLARDNGGKNAWVESEIIAWMKTRRITVDDKGPPREFPGLRHQRQKVEA
jgi:predicted DNA-binding transcriptional regulator AlpA